MKISEIFYTIQGESTFSGLPCTFVRTSGCNLRCSYCDTKYAYYGGMEISVEDVVESVIAHRLGMVSITGGEPLIERDVYHLMDILLSMRHRILLETNGSISIKDVPDRVVKIVDIKCPGSGESEKMNFGNLDLLTENDQVKFVIIDYEDYNWAKDVINKYKLVERAEVLLSPVYRMLKPRALAEWILRDRLKARLQVQLHKIIWGNNMEGGKGIREWEKGE